MVQPKCLRAWVVALASASVLGLALALGASALAATDDELRRFAGRVGLSDAEAFVQTIDSLDRTGRWPSWYLSKEEAARRGWKPGRDLWSVAPGKSIGGDAFANRERRLPAGLRYREADLDYKGGARNAKRLILGSDGRRWVTVDHYLSFQAVPP